MNAPAKHNGAVADAWKIIHYALGKFDDGAEVFSEWLHDQPTIDLPRLREACEELADRKRASSFVTITLATVRAEYLSRIPAGTVVQAVPPCTACGNTGVLGVVVAGESIGEAAIIRRNQTAPWGYVGGSTIPCDCPRGQRMLNKLNSPPPHPVRMRYLKDHCTMPLRAVDAMVRACRLEREKQQKETQENRRVTA